jgi:hypothetical protein
MRFLLAFDTQDNDLGDFWHTCMTDILTHIPNQLGYSSTLLRSGDLIKETIGNKIADYGGNSFVFLAYSHGQRNSLHGQYEAYVDTTSAYLFGRTFFYTFSCHVGSDLGPMLIENNCKAFIGYEDKARVETKHEKQFALCVNSGFKAFIEGKTVWECFCTIRNAYDDAMDTIYEENLVTYATYRRNRDALCCYGDKHLTIHDL